MFGSLQNKKINVYCGWYRNTVVKLRPVIKKRFCVSNKMFGM